ncbi:Spherulation-specific family 4 [Emericellopsis atlantica]|uniref:Spherulation-specific family 4 n=1 Tax=Emericellopsis atlantica TaxID=2614577 RepID=A0A9P7ZHD6_9HYPO|nr:Spherulation-specific family 4 [Emericellopsis atlantica]KAG9251736.1 Spherulation-specific family 4 [Emericellopsis atlantica]
MALQHIIVPLYIYPEEEAWAPLAAAARRHANINFLAIINPNNGPGAGPLPDASYRASLRRLQSISNIQLLGYVHCTYGRRPREDVCRDVDRYYGWNAQRLRVDGIFVDEVPSAADAVPYMADLATHVRSVWTRHSSAAPSVLVFNPGVVVDADLVVLADYVVAFEQAHEQWRVLRAEHEALRLEVCNKALAIVHTTSSEDGSIEEVLQDAKGAGFAGLYITDQHGGGFTRWPAQWDNFVQLLSYSTAREET